MEQSLTQYLESPASQSKADNYMPTSASDLLEVVGAFILQNDRGMATPVASSNSTS